MSPARALLDRCCQADVLLSVRDGKLVITPPPGGMREELLDEVAPYRDEIIALIRAGALDDTEQRYSLPRGVDWVENTLPGLDRPLIVVRSYRCIDDHPDLYDREIPVVNVERFNAMVGMSLPDRLYSYSQMVAVAVRQHEMRAKGITGPFTAVHWRGFCHGAAFPTEDGQP